MNRQGRMHLRREGLENRSQDRGHRPDKDAQMNASDVKENTLKYFEERFGLPRTIFDGYSIYLGPKGRLYLGPAKVPPNLRIVSPGLLIARADSAIKPSTNLFQLFGKQVEKNIISLTKEQTKKFVMGTDMILSKTEIDGISDGYVLVRYLDYNLGCALLKGTTLKNMVPKAKRLALSFI